MRWLLYFLISPVHEPTNAAGWRTIWRPNVVAAYDYVVVGTLNGVPALNVKADARDSALHLMSGAETKIVVDTMAGLIPSSSPLPIEVYSLHLAKSH